ncbi:unnamed protein product [Urochloa humidicola]
MAHPAFPLLETAYDSKHRAHLIIGNGEELDPLRPRTHSPMRWDERYACYQRRARLLPLARVVCAGLPVMDGPLLTCFVDRWRPETHSFHLPCGEVTVGLQDVAMILGLPLEGQAVTGIIQSDGWRDMVEAAIGLRPPEAAEGGREKKTAGVSSAWLRQHFNHCPPGAPDEVVERHARVWLWHLCGGFLFPDGQGNQVTWSVLPILSQQWENIGGYSWGSATLSWLYRQLCEACRRAGADSSLGGCAYLLQIWIWMRFAVGRPYRGELEVWPHNDEGSRPTVAFCWKNVPAVRGGPARRYKRYMDDLDCITESQIFWEPYTVDYAEELDGLGLSPMCTRDRQLWRFNVPLIFFHVVELHLPHRVQRQFGKLQTFPPEAISTSQALHRYDRRKRYAENDWLVTHANCLQQWEQRQRAEPELGAMHRHNHYIAYLRWYLSVTRAFVKPPLPDPTVPIENRPDTDDEADDITDAYDRLTREGTQVERAPVQNYMAQQLGRLANEAGVAMAHTSGGNAGAYLRAFAERVRRSCRRMAQKLNCIPPPDAAFTPGEPSSGPSSRATSSRATSSSRRTPVHHGAAAGSTPNPSCTSSVSRSQTARSTASGSRSSRGGRGKAPASPSPPPSEHSSGHNSEDSDPTYGGPQEVRMS